MPRTTFVLNWYFNNKKVWNCHTSEIFPEEDTKYTINSLLGSL